MSTTTELSTAPTDKKPGGLANSRKVWIRRKALFAEMAQTEAGDFMSLSKKSIGSYFEKGSQGHGSGMTHQERDILMPYLIDLPVEDREFRKKSADFFAGIATKVPYGEEGLELEIGLTISNDEPVTYFEKDGDKRVYNIPINILEYVRYRHAIKHPQVALSLKAASGDIFKQYYIYDPRDVVADRVDESKEGDTSLQSYLKIKDDKDKVWQMLVLLDIDPRMFPQGAEGDKQRALELRRLAVERSRKFNETYTDNMFESKYRLQAMINSGIIQKIGSQYINKETGRVIGADEKEALYFFSDPKNSEQVVLLMAHLQEANKQKVSKPNKNTRTPVGRN